MIFFIVDKFLFNQLNRKILLK